MTAATLPTAEELKAMSREIAVFSNEGEFREPEIVASIIWKARKAALALEAGLNGNLASLARREIQDAVNSYNEFKASL